MAEEGASLPFLSACVILTTQRQLLTMRQIDRLLARAGRNSELTYCECFLDDEDYSFYVKPLTMAQLVEARKSVRKGEQLSDLETSIKLFTIRALNADGTRQYQADAFSVLMRLPLEDLTKLAGAMNTEDEEDEELDIKSPDKGTEGREQPSSGTGRSRKAKPDAK